MTRRHKVETESTSIANRAGNRTTRRAGAATAGVLAVSLLAACAPNTGATDGEASPSPSPTAVEQVENSAGLPWVGQFEGPVDPETGSRQQLFERDSLENYPDIAKLLNMEDAEFAVLDENEQWHAISWVIQNKPGFDKLYYTMTLSDYDPSIPTSVNNTPTQIYGDYSSYLRFARSLRDESDTSDVQALDQNLVNKLLLTLADDESQPTIKLDTLTGRSYDPIALAVAEPYETRTDNITIFDDTLTHISPDSVSFDIQKDGNNIVTHTYTVVEYEDYKGNPAIGIIERYS